MSHSEPFEFITHTAGARAASPSPPQHRLFDAYATLKSAKDVDVDVQLQTALRARYPSLTVTAVPTTSVNLLAFAGAGHAVATPDVSAEDPLVGWRGYVPPARRGDGPGGVARADMFAKYRYEWGGENFIVYGVLVSFYVVQYVLKEPREGETPLSGSRVADELILAVGKWQASAVRTVWVYDRYWVSSAKMYQEAMRISWDDIIMEEGMKKELKGVGNKFFDNKAVYEEYGVPWKRGLIFHGPAGNGKTISIKAMIHTLNSRKLPIATLYVKTAPTTFDIRSIFVRARQMTPCLLVFEDIETIVTNATRSYFFNEVDGLENNDGILMVASTNYLDRLDPGLSKRPSRFDRKYLFSLPSKEQRVKYCEHWHDKLRSKPIEFPHKLCEPIAEITYDFSFATLQEAFVSTLLVLAREETPDGAGDPRGEGYQETSGAGGENAVWSGEADGGDDLERYELWRVIKQQVAILREDMDHEEGSVRRRTSTARSTRDSASAAEMSASTGPCGGDGDAILQHDRFASDLGVGKPRLPVRPVTDVRAAEVAPTALRLDGLESGPGAQAWDGGLDGWDSFLLRT
ncbi:P-loop containing nucleoside triphosphate hydrolase protein [Lineolata rhizophorae]|uniref:P-loop containing nucleoside triphosphate hydrolase protein n=1 Tax=Lineolata rhizophorae TaxID=578093 RepID=A0A6A6NSU2_9PEZI|nr:P-loop containing nucleoside triphosphate hydrolase protein [Lineolata rhizophorae]